MKKFKKEITIYDLENGFCVEVSENKDERINEDIIEFHLYHKNYGIKDSMFGIFKKDIKEEWEIEDYIKRNVEDYIKIYKEDYMEDFIEDENEINKVENYEER